MERINYIVNSTGEKMQMNVKREYLDEILDKLNIVGVAYLTEDIVFEHEFKVLVDDEDGTNVGYLLHNKKPLKAINYPTDDCPVCGRQEATVLTDAEEDDDHYYVNDGDEATCNHCGHTGVISVEDSECADVVWDSLTEDEDE